MKSYLTLVLLAFGLGGCLPGFAQNVFVLKKEAAKPTDSVPPVLMPAPSNGAVCINLDSLRREIFANRDIYLEWRRNRQQAWYWVDIDENGQPSNFRADGRITDMHAWMQQYLGAMRFQPAWNPGANQRVPQASTLRICLPDLEWPRFEQEYHLASLVEGRARQEKPGQCVEGYVRLRVLTDAGGKPLSHQVLAGENDLLNRWVGDELYKTGFKPAVAPGDSQAPETTWGFLDFQFATKSCR